MRLLRLSLIASGLMIAAAANAENSRLTPTQMDDRDLHSLLSDSAPELNSPALDEEDVGAYYNDEPVGSGVYSTSAQPSDAPVPPAIGESDPPHAVAYPPAPDHHHGLWEGYCNKSPKILHRSYGCQKAPYCRPKCRLPKIHLPKICLPKIHLPKVKCCPKPCCKRPGLLRKIVDRLRHCGRPCKGGFHHGHHGLHVHHHTAPAPPHATYGPYDSYGPHNTYGPPIHDSYDAPFDFDGGIEPEMSPQDSLDAPPPPPTEARRRFPLLRLNP